VGADDEARAAVDEMAERLLLAGRLGVESTIAASQPIPSGQAESSCSPRWNGSSSASMNTRPIRLTTSTRAPPRPRRDWRRAPACRRDNWRADEPRLALDEHQSLTLIKGVIAECDRVGAGGEELVADRFGDAEAAGGVLAVDDDEIELPPLAQSRQAADQRRAPGPADDVADEQEPHQPRPARRSIRAR